MDAGLAIDAFAPRLSFFWGIGMNPFMEIAKMRAARFLWSKHLKALGAEHPKSMALRTHSQTSGWSLTEQDPYNNVTRTAIEAMAATMGGTQSLHTNSLDEAIALPTDFSARIARNTQLHLQLETDITFTADPWGGSYYVEKLTADLIDRATALMDEVEALGGMTKAIEAGIPKLRIEEAAAKKQARIDSGADIIVGVNAFENGARAELDILEVRGDEVREAQVAGLAALRAARDQQAVDKALAALSKCAKSGEGNLLALAVEAAKVRATLGEISLALEENWGRYVAKTQTISGVYSNEMKMNKDFEAALVASDRFAEKAGRRPRIMVAKMGQDGHDRGAKVVATSFADLGFDVDMGPLFQTPKEAAKQAVENDVHILGVSSLAAGHKSLVPAVLEELKALGRADILVIVGGVIPAQDYEFLYDQGVAGIFGPGTKIAQAATAILDILIEMEA